VQIFPVNFSHLIIGISDGNKMNKAYAYP